MDIEETNNNKQNIQNNNNIDYNGNNLISEMILQINQKKIIIVKNLILLELQKFQLFTKNKYMQIKIIKLLKGQ